MREYLDCIWAIPRALVYYAYSTPLIHMQSRVPSSSTKINNYGLRSSVAESALSGHLDLGICKAYAKDCAV